MDNPIPDDKALKVLYEVDYEINDVAFFEPFQVFKPVGREGFAWWNGAEGRGKVEKLFNAFKIDLTVGESCISAGISYEQYRYFGEVHPLLSQVKQRLKGVLPIAAKQGLVKDIQSDEGYRSRQWYLERRQPEIYGRDTGAIAIPPGGSVARRIEEAFMDEDGNVIMSRQAAELLKDHGANETTSE